MAKPKAKWVLWLRVRRSAKEDDGVWIHRYAVVASANAPSAKFFLECHVDMSMREAARESGGLSWWANRGNYAILPAGRKPKGAK